MAKTSRIRESSRSRIGENYLRRRLESKNDKFGKAHGEELEKTIGEERMINLGKRE